MNYSILCITIHAFIIKVKQKTMPLILKKRITAHIILKFTKLIASNINKISYISTFYTQEIHEKVRYLLSTSSAGYTSALQQRTKNWEKYETSIYYYNEQSIITPCTNYYQSNDYAALLPPQSIFLTSLMEFGRWNLEDGIWKMEFGRWNLKRRICETKSPSISGDFGTQIP